MTRVAFATAAPWADLAADDRLAAAELEKRGLTVCPALWDSPTEDWAAYDAVVIRSTWDYHTRHAAYLDWLGRLKAAHVYLFNPPEVMRWNSNKTYLQDLARDGVRIPPTMVVEQFSAPSLERLVREAGWEKAVVKPTVAANAYETWMTDLGTLQHTPDGQSAFEALLRKSTVLLQAYLPEVATGGEWSFIFFNKAFSHAVLKRPREGDFRVQENYGGKTSPVEAPGRLIAQAERICRTVRDDLLYARVDGVEVNGELVLMELELIEPSLFFGSHPQAAGRFADALLTCLAP